MQIEPLTAHIGADVLDVDVSRLTDAEFEEIHRAWLDHLVLRIRGQKLDDDALQAFSRRFGPLEKMPLGRLSAEQRARIRNPYVTVLSNIKVDGRPIGGLGNAEANWHSDMSYLERPPTASVLLGVEIPPSGGDTYFASQYAALEALPDALRARVETVTIKHDAAHTSVSELRPGFEPFDDPRDAPGAVHPAIRIHPETGKPCLFLGRREWAYVPGLPLEASEVLLDEVWQYAARPAYVFRQQWQVGDLLVWDNRCTLHRRDEFPANSRRMMRRCQVLHRAAAD